MADFYFTLRDVSVIFRKNERTIRRWIDEGREITLDGRLYIPEKDPGGRSWLFLVVKAKMAGHKRT